MRRLLAALVVLWALTTPAPAGTRVWLMYGWGDNAFGSSSGIDTIAAQAARIPGVTSVRVYNYWQTQQIANEIAAAPHDRIFVGGYSCGANSSAAISTAFNGVRKINIATIQPSVWCGNYPLGSAITYAQETYAGCILTLGFGCLVYSTGPGFTGTLVKIRRPDLHPFADQDPDAQRDVLGVIASTANPGLRKAYGVHLVRGRTTEIVRYHGQRP